VVSRVKRMASSRVGMMRGFLVVSATVMLGRLTVMVGGVGMMFRGLHMMFSCFFRHEYHLCSVAEIDQALRGCVREELVLGPLATAGIGRAKPGRLIIKLDSQPVVPVTVLLQRGTPQTRAAGSGESTAFFNINQSREGLKMRKRSIPWSNGFGRTSNGQSRIAGVKGDRTWSI
jgi:hypothetical protein